MPYSIYYNTIGDGDIILFHIYLCQLVSAFILLVKLSEMFATLMSLKCALLAG